mgnify:FL=1
MKPFKLPFGSLLLQSSERKKSSKKHLNGDYDSKLEHDESFAFLSIFKWEQRKGWDVLVRAYLSEFTAGDNVSLYLLTNKYHVE